MGIRSLNEGPLAQFWKAPARNRVLYGGRVSGKSWATAEAAIVLAQCMRLRFLCTRQFQNRIDESVYTLLKHTIVRCGWESKFKITENKIVCVTTGSEFVFYGLWRSVDEIKSLESIDIHWAEEAHLLTEAQWKVIDPTLRNEFSQHWIVFNPRLASDFVYQRFVVKPPAKTIVRKLNYDENPFLSRTILEVIDAAKEDDFEEYEHVYLGVPRSDDEQSVISRSHVIAALDAHRALGIEPTGRKCIGFDVADAGEDFCATIEAHGSLATWSEEWKAREDELLKSCTRVWTRARDSSALVIYDAIGVGAGCGAKFNELNSSAGVRVQHEKFMAGGAVLRPEERYGNSQIKNKDFFANVKAQVWWLTADRFRNTFNAVRNGHQFGDADMLFIDSAMPNLDKIMDELCTPKRDYDPAGRVKVESKKDLAKRQVKSPNLGDAFVMAFGPVKRPMVISDAALLELST